MRMWVAALLAAAVSTPTAGTLSQDQDPDSAWSRSAIGTAAVIGQIIDDASGEGIRRAIVRLEGPDVTLTRVADDQGRFYFRSLPAGAFRIDASRYGYLDGSFGRARPGGSRMELPLADGQWRTGITVTLFHPAVISGAVDDESNEPLVGVMVQALRREIIAGRPRFVASASGITDDRGFYRIHGLTPGTYVVSVPSPQVTIPIETLEQVAETGSATSEMITIFFMNPFDSSGPGGGGVGMARALETAQTDGQHLLMPGRLPQARFSPDGRSALYVTSFYPSADLPSFALPVSVASGEERTGLNMQLRPVPTARISGAVVGPDGPVRGQMLRLVPEGGVDFGLGSETAATIVAPDGTFTFLGVPAGHYVIEARNAVSTLLLSPLSQLASLNEYLPTMSIPTAPLMLERALWGRASVAVYGDHLDHVVVTMVPGMTIAGRVAFDGTAPLPSAEDLSRVRVSVERPGGQGSGVPPGPVDASGEFVIHGVVPGQYFVRVSVSPDGWYLREARTAGRDVSDVPLDATTGIDVTDLVIHFTDRPTDLTGTARAPSGVPMPGATVVVFPATRLAPTDYGLMPRRIRSARADIYGVYRLRGLPPGSYFVAALDDADADGWQDPPVLKDLRASAAPMTLTEAERQVRDVTLTTFRGGRRR